MKIPKHIRETADDINITLRSLDTLAQCHGEFMTKSNGNLKRAKLHNNVIGEAFFDIPLSQVKYTIYSILLSLIIIPLYN